MTKVLLIGIDGGTWKILNPAIEQGYMPCLKEMVETGASGVLVSTIPAITPAAWGTFQTGVNPGANGVFDFSYWDKKQKRHRYVNSNSLQETIWQSASNAGKRVGVLNVPMTYPPYEVKGYMVTGILTPSIDSEFTYPAEIKEQLLSAVPGYHIFNLGNTKKEFMYTKFESLVERIISILDSRTKAAEFVINKGPLDLFMVHFQANDILQHMLWGYLDEDHPLYNQAKRDYIFDRYYKYLDSRIDYIRQTFKNTTGDDYLTIIVSDHGFETHFKRINLGNWLAQEGFLKVNPQPSHPNLLKSATRKLGVGKFLKRFIPEYIVDRTEKKLKISTDYFSWRDSRAFSVGRSDDGFIYLLEEEDEQRRKTTSSLIEKLKALRDAETSSEVVKKVYLKEDIFHGDLMDIMPDLIIEPVTGYSCTGGIQPDEGLFHKVHPGSDFHIGKHHPNGIIIANGPNIRQQKTIQAQLIDIMPTLSYYMRLPISKNLDGRVVRELFTKEFTSRNPTPERIDKKFIKEGSRQKGYTAEDENIIQQRLKELGYM